MVSWRGELREEAGAGEEDFWKCGSAEKSLSEGMEAMEWLREVDLESRGRVSALLVRRWAEYCRAARVLSWILTSLFCRSMSSDFLFSFIFSNPGLPP